MKTSLTPAESNNDLSLSVLPADTPGTNTASPNGVGRHPSFSGPSTHKYHPPQRSPAFLAPLLIISGFAAFFVIWEVAQRHIFTELTIGMRHFLLTMRAITTTFLIGGIMYITMWRQQRRLSDTAKQLSTVLASYKAQATPRARFENPNLVRCRDVLSCQRTQCPVYETPGERCWQIVALSNNAIECGAPSVSIEQCQKCAVYRQSCPDEMAELGEAFNNLMFLLDEESAQVGRMRVSMIEKEKMVAIGQMASGIAHEIGNPLSSISSIAQLLKRRKAIEPNCEELGLILQHIQRISNIVRQLSRLARPGDDHWESTNIIHTLEEAVKLVSFDRRARNVNITFHHPPTLPNTCAMRGQMQQVFINLLLNALDAMPDGGKLSVSSEKYGRNLHIQIKDTGIGIPTGIGRRIFEPFFTTKQPGQGTGMGLAVSYGIIGKHGGSIDFMKNGDQGTIFTIILPILQHQPGDENESTHYFAGR